MATRESCREAPEPPIVRIAPECLITSPHRAAIAAKRSGYGVVILQPAAPLTASPGPQHRLRPDANLLVSPKQTKTTVSRPLVGPDAELLSPADFA